MIWSSQAAEKPHLPLEQVQSFSTLWCHIHLPYGNKKKHRGSKHWIVSYNFVVCLTSFLSCSYGFLGVWVLDFLSPWFLVTAGGSVKNVTTIRQTSCASFEPPFSHQFCQLPSPLIASSWAFGHLSVGFYHVLCFPFCHFCFAGWSWLRGLVVVSCTLLYPVLL